MLTDALFVFAWLVVLHLLCDYPLQGDFMAKAKNHKTAIPGVPWYTLMASHAFIHAAAVAMLTGSYLCVCLEFFSHFLIDTLKCEGEISYNTDQALHIGMKACYVLLLMGGLAP